MAMEDQIEDLVVQASEGPQMRRPEEMPLTPEQMAQLRAEQEGMGIVDKPAEERTQVQLERNLVALPKAAETIFKLATDMEEAAQQWMESAQELERRYKTLQADYDRYVAKYGPLEPEVSPDTPVAHHQV